MGQAMNIEALVISTDEPQLNACLASVDNQTVPFSRIIHVNNVVPEYLAFNQAMSQTKEQWALNINGDMILHPYAVKMILMHMESDDNIYGYFFFLWDAFLECVIGYICLLNTKAFKSMPHENVLRDDYTTNVKLRRQGWVDKRIDRDILLGSHFKDPDEFQVFRRFFIHGCKYANNYGVKKRMMFLRKTTNNPLYWVGINAIKFAKTKGPYPTSHNLEYDWEMYNEFKSLHNNSNTE